MLYTTKQIAQVAQVSQRWVQKIARRLGVPKYGRDYLAHQMQLVEIMKELHKSEGGQG